MEREEEGAGRRRGERSSENWVIETTPSLKTRDGDIYIFGGAFLRISFAGPFSSEGKQINSGAGQKRAVTSWGIINVALFPPLPENWSRNRQSRHWRVGSRAVCRPTPAAFAFSRGQWQLCGFRLVNRGGRGRKGKGGSSSRPLSAWMLLSSMIHDDGAVRLVTGAQEGSPICRGTGLSLLRRLIIESSRDIILIVERLTKREIRLAKINIELGPVFLKV